MDALRLGCVVIHQFSRSREEGKLFLFQSQSMILIHLFSPALIFPHLALDVEMCKTSGQADFVERMLILNEKPQISTCRSQH